MSEDSVKSSMNRREALLTMAAGAAFASAPQQLFAGNDSGDSSEANKGSGEFLPTLPFKIANEGKFRNLDLYGKCNGLIDLILADFSPELSKYGEMLNEKGEVVKDPKAANLKAQKNVVLYARDMPGPENYGETPKLVMDPSGEMVEVGADFGGHYHEKAEVIYCTKGKMRIEIRENSGKEIIDFEGDKVVEKKAEAEHGERKFQYIAKAGDKVKMVDLTEELQVYNLEPGGMISIPARAYHSVIMLETGDMVAYLPDGKRWAELAVSDPTPGAACQHEKPAKGY